MDLRKLLTPLLAAFFFVVPISASAQFAPGGVIGPSTFTFTAGSQSNIWSCNGGQSTFQLSVPTGFTGVLTVTVAQVSIGNYSNPPWSYAPGTPAYTNTITNSGSLTVNLGSNLYVQVADTTYTSGSVTVTGTCSGAVASVPPQVTSVSGSGNVTSTGGTAPIIGFLSTPSFTSITATSGMVAGSSTYGPTSATVNGLLTLPAGGTATSSTNYGSNNLQLNNSVWNGTAPVTNRWDIFEDSSNNLTADYNNAVSWQVSSGSEFFALGGYDASSSFYGPTSATVNGVVNNQPTGATVVGPAGACYQANGTACAGSFHTVFIPEQAGSCTANTSTTSTALEAICNYNVTFTGSAVFSSALSYACEYTGGGFSNAANSTPLAYHFVSDNLSGSSVNFTGYYFYTATGSGTVTFTPFQYSGAVCSGT